jgi:hypothetical protein
MLRQAYNRHVPTLFDGDPIGELWDGEVEGSAPRGRFAVAQIRPLWLSIIDWQIDNPIPMPPGLVV